MDLLLNVASLLVGFSSVGPSSETGVVEMPTPTPPVNGMIELPNNQGSRVGDGITIVGESRRDAPAPVRVETGLFGRPIIARSDLVFRSFDKRLSITEIHYPGRRCRPIAPTAPVNAREVEMRNNLAPIESRFPPSPGR